MTDLGLGLDITPHFFPTEEEEVELHVPYYRSILYELNDIQVLLNLDKPFIITLNNQCREVGGDWHGWDATVLRICELLKERNRLDKLLVLGAGNEFDIYYHDNRSVPPEFGADLARRTARIAHNYGIKVSATSVAGPEWPHYLQVMADLCRDDVDYFDLHPYGQRPDGFKTAPWMHGELRNAMNTAQDIAQKPVIVTEYGVKIRDAGSEEDVADFLYCANDTLETMDVPYKCWFAYSDAIGAPTEQGLEAFGLVGVGNKKRPAYEAFSVVNEGDNNMSEDNDNIYEKWGQHVGAGLLDMMVQDGTEPCMASEWRPFDRPAGTPATIEQCIGLNNVTYCYNLNTGSGWRIRPS